MKEEPSQTQLAKAKLRESFLSAICELKGQPCNILTYENTKLQAKFAGWKPDSTEVLVRDLNTPANICMQTALLRTPDIIYIQFDKPVQLP